MQKSHANHERDFSHISMFHRRFTNRQLGHRLNNLIQNIQLQLLQVLELEKLYLFKCEAAEVIHRQLSR